MQKLIFSTIDNALDIAINTLSKFTNLASVIDMEHSEKLWRKFLKEKGLKYFFQENHHFSIFTLCGLTGYYKPEYDNSYYEIFLQRIDSCIGKLKTTDLQSFSHKLRNPEGLSFFSTLSELFLAEYYYERGFDISYEIPFDIHLTNSKTITKNIDIQVSNEHNKWIIEVYNPVDLMDRIHGDEVFFGDNLEDYKSFLMSVNNKIEKKFLIETANGYTNLDGNLLFAVNIHYHDRLMTSLFSPFNFKERFVNDIEAILKKTNIIRGAILFENDSMNPASTITMHHSPIDIKPLS